MSEYLYSLTMIKARKTGEITTSKRRVVAIHCVGVSIHGLRYFHLPKAIRRRETSADLLLRTFQKNEIHSNET